MTEISVVAQEIAALRPRGIPADAGALWETLRLEAERAAAGEFVYLAFTTVQEVEIHGRAGEVSCALLWCPARFICRRRRAQ